MSNTSFPIIKHNQVTLSQLKSQQDTASIWKKKQQTLKRFKLNFPDLSESFAPDWNELPKVLQNLQEFNDNHGGYSPHTLKMLALVLRKWDHYCKSEQVYSFPIAPNIILIWLQGLKLSGLKINTLKQYRAQLRVLSQSFR